MPSTFTGRILYTFGVYVCVEEAVLVTEGGGADNKPLSMYVVIRWREVDRERRRDKIVGRWTREACTERNHQRGRGRGGERERDRERDNNADKGCWLGRWRQIRVYSVGGINRE